MTQTIWIARHGNRLDFVNPDWFNTAPRRYDPPLSEDGKIQAQQLANRLKPENIKHIFVSPFLRTIETAYPIAQTLNLSLKIEAGLSEWLNPHWMTDSPETHPLDWLTTHYPSINSSYSSRIIPQYPETEDMMNERTGATVLKLIEDFTEDILLVGHGASVVGTTRKLVGETADINAALCCLVKVVKQNQRWKLILNGDTSHLSQTEDKIRFN
ncbi:MAG: histidine phosphatase family protein [Microcystaceae cyanobacterium]